MYKIDLFIVKTTDFWATYDVTEQSASWDSCGFIHTFVHFLILQQQIKPPLVDFSQLLVLKWPTFAEPVKY